MDSTYLGGMKMAKAKTKKAKSEKPRKPKLVKLYDTELEPLQEADGLLKQIETAESEAAERSLRVELCREKLTDAKTAYKDAVAQLRRLCRARKEKHPLFDQTKPAELTKEPPAKEAARKSNEITIRLTKSVDDATNGFHGTTGETLTAAIDTQGDTYIPVQDGDVYLEAEEFEVVEPIAEKETANNGWQDLPLSSAGINGKVGVLLAEAGHDTLGRLAKLMADHGQWWNKEVKGIGEAGATEVADRFAAFWAEHPEYCAA